MSPTPPSPIARLKKRPAATGSYTFTFDPADAQRVADAEAVLDEARRAAEAQPKSPTLKKAHTDARKARNKVVESTVTVTVTVEAIGASALEELQHEHPPTEQQLENAEASLKEGERLLYDPETYGPAVLARSLTRLEFSDDPDGAVTSISEADAGVLWEGFAQLDRLEIFSMITAINMRSSKVDLVGKD